MVTFPEFLPLLYVVHDATSPVPQVDGECFLSCRPRRSSSFLWSSGNSTRLSNHFRIYREFDGLLQTTTRTISAGGDTNKSIKLVGIDQVPEPREY